MLTDRQGKLWREMLNIFYHAFRKVLLEISLQFFVDAWRDIRFIKLIILARLVNKSLNTGVTYIMG